MTLDECYQANVGKSLLVPGGGTGNQGQCVQWADTVLNQVYGLPYVYANAINWWNNAQVLQNFTQVTDGSIQKGDFVIFNSKVGSVYGHIDVAMTNGTIDSFLGADSNWSGNLTVHEVQHVGRQYVIGALRQKGVDSMKSDQATVTLGYQIGFNRSPGAGELSNYLGMDVNTFLAAILANNFDFRNKAANFDRVQAQLTALENQPAEQQIEAIKKIIGS